jgi:hypothetical protein
MSQLTLKIGDRVKFRKGGPPTLGPPIVKQIHEDGRVSLAWIGRSGIPMHGSCRAHDLELISDRSRHERGR